MQYQEELLWILDYPEKLFDEEKRKENIDFVHSLGQKCDCVGWSTLKLENPRAGEILEKIAAFCKGTGWVARGYYDRTFINLESDWYEISGPDFRDSTEGDQVEVPAEDGGTTRILSIRAYHELTTSPKRWELDRLYLPERFRDVYNRRNLSGLDFCWLKDTGKYAAEQYFAAYGTQQIPRVAIAWDLRKSDRNKVCEAGGWLPQLTKVVHQFDQINLPECYLEADMPAGGIAYVYIPATTSHWGFYSVLVHKDIASLLLQEKAIPASALKPVPVVKEIPAGYTLRDTKAIPRPNRKYMEQSILAYDKLKTKDRPARKISEKDALKIMRKAKTERKEDFQKKLPKKREEELLKTEFAPLVPYYRVAEGGFLSDEYELLSPKDIQTETTEFYDLLMKEELLEEQPKGMVIACCANGDKVLLCINEKVIRFSHEAPEVIDEWPSLAQFVFDAVSEE